LPKKEEERKKKRKTRESIEEETPWHVLCETKTRLCSSGYMMDLAAIKI
jgi:hypothetical protein